MRHTYVIGDQSFLMRTFTQRDMTKITGKLAILPDGSEKAKAAISSNVNDIADRLLVTCSITPKLTLDDPVEIPAGVLPISELSDELYGELVKRLCADSGWGAEAVSEVRPSSGTVEGS